MTGWFWPHLASVAEQRFWECELYLLLTHDPVGRSVSISLVQFNDLYQKPFTYPCAASPHSLRCSLTRNTQSAQLLGKIKIKWYIQIVFIEQISEQIFILLLVAHDGEDNDMGGTVSRASPDCTFPSKKRILMKKKNHRTDPKPVQIMSTCPKEFLPTNRNQNCPLGQETTQSGNTAPELRLLPK